LRKKSIDEATKQLYEQGDIMGALITRYGDAGRALKAMQKELQTMAALGQNNTKEFKELTKATAELTGHNWRYKRRNKETRK
jgi:multidrug resistance efflux pump